MRLNRKKDVFLKKQFGQLKYKYNELLDKFYSNIKE